MTTKSAPAPAPEPPPDWTGRRADARRNHERVLAAAIEVFTEHGLDATIPQVAKQAGVGKATVYRSYPTKADLVRAIAQVHVAWFEDLARQAAEAAETDAYRALDVFLQIVTTRLAEDRLMIEVLSGIGGLESTQADDSFERAVACGRLQGALRSDATVMDLRVLVSGFATALIELDIHDPDIWRRYATLALAALRP